MMWCGGITPCCGMKTAEFWRIRLIFNEECSYRMMDQLKKDGTLSSYVQNCVTSNGGSGYEDGVNTLLARESRLKTNQTIYAIPMVRVNEFTIHGNIDCAPPVTSASCEVLSAICAGFLEDTEPEVCALTPAPTMANCTEEDRDCAGECFGNHFNDSCGECLLISSHEWNACIGCNGLTNGSQFDCEGTCGGHYAVNECGYCKDERQPGFADFGKDCIGGCNRSLKLDRCDQCLAESDQDWDSCVGCDNVANSGRSINPCGYCILSDAEDFASYGMSCRGDCESAYAYDECGECKAEDDASRNSCLGCDGVANSGKEINDCGMCISTSDANFDDYGKDCKGICSTTVDQTHYEDECGNCLLTSDPSWNECDGADEDTQELTKKESELTTIIVVVCVVAFLIVIAAAIIIGALKKRQDAIKERFDSLASTYHHMDNMDSNVNFTQMNRPPDDRAKKSTKGDLVRDDNE